MRTRFSIHIWITPIGGLFKPGCVLGEDVWKIMYVTVHVTDYVAFAILELVELAVLGSHLYLALCSNGTQAWWWPGVLIAVGNDLIDEFNI